MNINRTRKYILILLIICASNALSLDFDGKSYKIKSKFSEYCMEVEGSKIDEGTKVIQYPCKSNSSQEFLFTKTASGYYTMTSSSGQQLKVNKLDVNIVQSSVGSLFIIEQQGLAYTIKDKVSNKYITANVYNTDVKKSPRNNQYNQLWLFEN